MEKEKLSLRVGETELLKTAKIPFYLNSNVEVYFKMEDKNISGTWIDRYVNMEIENIMSKNSEGILAYGHSREFITSLAVYTARMGVNLYLFISKEDYESTDYSMFLLFDLKIIVVNGEKEEIIEIMKKIDNIYPLNYVEYILDDYAIKGMVFEIKNKVNKVDYIFMNIDKNNSIYYNYLRDFFMKESIEFVGITLDQEISKEKNITLIENYELELAYQSLLKNEGIIATKETAINFAGVDNYDKIIGFKENSNVILILKEDKVKLLENQYEDKVMDLNISIIDTGYENFLNILKLKKIEV